MDILSAERLSISILLAMMGSSNKLRTNSGNLPSGVGGFHCQWQEPYCQRKSEISGLYGTMKFFQQLSPKLNYSCSFYNTYPIHFSIPIDAIALSTNISILSQPVSLFSYTDLNSSLMNRATIAVLDVTLSLEKIRRI
jgi:hypothetical protein